MEQETKAANRRIVSGNAVLSGDGRELIRYRQQEGAAAVPETVEVICTYAFWSDRISEIVLPPRVRVIEERAFLNCWKLEKVVLPPDLQKIGTGAFCGCGSLREIQLPENLRTLGSEVFDGTGITELVLPRGLDWVEHHALRGCKLQRLTIQGTPLLPEEISPEWELREDAELVADALEIEEYPQPYTGEHGVRGFARRWWAGEPMPPQVVERFRRYLQKQYEQYKTDRDMFRLMAVLGAIPADKMEDALNLALDQDDPALTVAVLSARHNQPEGGALS